MLPIYYSMLASMYSSRVSTRKYELDHVKLSSSVCFTIIFYENNFIFFFFLSPLEFYKKEGAFFAFAGVRILRSCAKSCLCRWLFLWLNCCGTICHFFVTVAFCYNLIGSLIMSFPLRWTFGAAVGILAILTAVCVFLLCELLLISEWGLRALSRLRGRGDLDGVARLPHADEDFDAPAPSLHVLPSPTFLPEQDLREAEEEHRATLRSWADHLSRMDGSFPLAADPPRGVDAEERRGVALFLLSATLGGVPQPRGEDESQD